MFDRALKPPAGLLALIAAVTLVPLATLAWLGWRWLQQDETSQVRQHLDASADIVVSALNRSLAAAEQQLATGVTDWPEGVVVLTVDLDAVDVTPRRRVAFLPVVQSLPEAPPARFADAEATEHQRKDAAAAMAAYRSLAETRDTMTRAGALVRLARVQRRDGLLDAALATYNRLLTTDEVRLDDVPIALAARYARCRLLESERRTAELATEADLLLHDLHSARWRLTAPVYWLYVADARRWTGAPTEALRTEELLAEAVAVVHGRSVNEGRARKVASGRELVAIDDHTFAVLWRSTSNGLRALVVQQGSVVDEWLSTAQDVARTRNVAFSIDTPEPAGTRLAAASGVIVRSAAESGLPWDLSVTMAKSFDVMPSLVSRRRLLLAGFGLVATMTLAAGYFVVRGVGREIAAVRQQSDFLAAVSHEFRTPLTTLRQFTERLREHPVMPEERRRVCYDAQARATDRLTHLVESLLDFGRMEARAHPYAFASCDAAAMVRDVVGEFQPDAQAAGYEIRLNDGEVVPIRADRQALARAIWNLLDNAVKYSPGQRLIEVDLQRVGQAAVISVRDHGLGIPADEQKAVFTKFRRGTEARSRGINGTGLGLAMVAHIVAAHQGRVEIESEPTKGSTFRIWLPVAQS